MMSILLMSIIRMMRLVQCVLTQATPFISHNTVISLFFDLQFFSLGYSLQTIVSHMLFKIIFTNITNDKWNKKQLAKNYILSCLKCFSCLCRLSQSRKGTVQRDFGPPFFSSFEPAWATDQQVKTFSILVSFSPRYSYFSESPRGIIPRRVSLLGVSNPGKTLITPGSQLPILILFAQTFKGTVSQK